jgi:hypothetical protein
MYRVKAKVETEKDKKHSVASQKRAALEDKSNLSRPQQQQRHQQRRRSSQPRSGSGLTPTTILPPSPTAISPLTSITNTASLPVLASNPTSSPTSSFTPISLNGTRSFTPQSQTESSPGEIIYPFALGQRMHNPFGNSPPLYPPGGQQQQQSAPLPAEMVDVPGEDDGSGQFWQSLFGPPGSSLPPPIYNQSGFAQPFASTQQGVGSNISPDRATGEFRDPNDVNIDTGGDVSGIYLDDGLVDWSDFIAQCSQVWVTE